MKIDFTQIKCLERRSAIRMKVQIEEEDRQDRNLANRQEIQKFVWKIVAAIHIVACRKSVNTPKNGK